MKKNVERCPWCLKDDIYMHYHDTVWGHPERDDRKLFAKLCLDGAQAGLSWYTILIRTEGYAKAFDDWDAEKIARYTPKKIEKLLLDPGIIRNRQTVESVVKNANAYLGALLYRSNTDYLFPGPQSGSGAQGAALSLYARTNAVGGNANGMDVNVPGGRVRFNHTNGGFESRADSTSGYTGAFEINDVGLEIGHNSVSRNIQLVNGGGERVRIDATGRVGVGTSAPQRGCM